MVDKCCYSDEKKAWIIPRFRLTNNGLLEKEQQ